MSTALEAQKDPINTSDFQQALDPDPFLMNDFSSLVALAKAVPIPKA